MCIHIHIFTFSHRELKVQCHKNMRTAILIVAYNPVTWRSPKKGHQQVPVKEIKIRAFCQTSTICTKDFFTYMFLSLAILTDFVSHETIIQLFNLSKN